MIFCCDFIRFSLHLAENTDSQQQSSTPAAEGETQNNVPLFKGGAMFKPFSKDPEKQSRYDNYLELVKKGHKGKRTLKN